MVEFKMEEIELGGVEVALKAAIENANFSPLTAVLKVRPLFFFSFSLVRNLTIAICAVQVVVRIFLFDIVSGKAEMNLPNVCQKFVWSDHKHLFQLNKHSLSKKIAFAQIGNYVTVVWIELWLRSRSPP